MSSRLIKWMKKPLPLSKLYCVFGEEGFLVPEIKKTLLKNMRFKKGMEDFNFTETAADKISVGDFLSLIETLPLLSEKRLVFCDRAESFQDKDWKQIQDFLPSGKGSNGESDLVLAFPSLTLVEG